jgi:hypothetical protein
MNLRRFRLTRPLGACLVLLAALPPPFSARGLCAQSPGGSAGGKNTNARAVGGTLHPAAHRLPGAAPHDSAQLGEHSRFVSPRGVIHVWRPGPYNARSAGIVVYVHGYFTDVDQAWADDHLAEQFQASGRNALFVTPEAPEGRGEEVRWKNLTTLLSDVEQGWDSPLPAGPIVLVGHSAAYRTIVNWLHDPRVKSVILLDGLYRNERQFLRWLRYAPNHQSHHLVLVANDTARHSQRLARRFPQARKLNRIPDSPGEFTPQEKRARLLLLRSQYEHMEIVSSGKVIPVLLELAPLSTLALPSPVE